MEILTTTTSNKQPLADGDRALLECKLQVLAFHLQHAASSLTGVSSAVEATRRKEAPWLGNELSQLRVQLNGMQDELQRIVARVESQHEEQRESFPVKMEVQTEKPGGAVYDSDETEDELLMLEKAMDEAHRFKTKAQARAAIKREPAADSAMKTPVVAVVTPREESFAPEKVHQASEPPKTTETTDARHEVETVASVLPKQRQLNEQLDYLRTIVVGVERAHCHPRSGAPRCPIAPDLLESTAETIHETMEKLLEVDMQINLVQPLLRVRDTFLKIRHPDLKKVLAGSSQILHGLINSFPETLGGLSHTHPSPVRDRVAQECFATAIDLFTTTDTRRRGELVDQALRELKSGFRQAIALRKLPTKPFKRLRQPLVDPKTKCMFPWAGRVLLLAMHIVAFVVATHERNKTDHFVSVTQVINARHVLFPALLERSRRIAVKPPRMVLDNSQTHPRRLQLQHEAYRIAQICARVCEQ